MTPSGLSEHVRSVRSGELDHRRWLEQLITKLHGENQRLEIFSRMHEKPEGARDGPLAGVPFSVKDNICVKGFPTRAGSRILVGYMPPFEATVVRRMKAAGAAFIGTTNMDEFGFGTFCTNCGFGIPKNPSDVDRCCGGSSGGAGAATAIIEHHVALAESTGGSISCPAAFCGVVGFTPTYGRVSRYGLIDYANSLDKIGLMARTIEHVAVALPIIAGPDEKDPTSMAQPELDLEVRGLRSIAVPSELVGSVTDDRISSLFTKAVDKLRDSGMEVSTVDIPALRYSIPSYYILACAEASTNLARYCGMRYGKEGTAFDHMYDDFFTDVRTESLGVEAKRRVMLGTFARMAGYRDQYYMKALRVRRRIIEQFKDIFREYDLVASPTMPLLPPRFEEISEMSPATIYALDFLTVPPNLAGLPHLSLPMGYADGLPAGVHFIADHWQEAKLIGIGRQWESMTEYRLPMNLGGLR